MLNRIASINKLRNIKNIYKKGFLLKNFAEDISNISNASSGRISFNREKIPKNIIIEDTKYFRIIDKFLNKSSKNKEDLNGDFEKVVNEKYKDLTKEDLKNQNYKSELSEILNKLINDKLRIQLINAYSTNNTLSEKNILMKKIFEEIDNKINEQEEEKKIDYEIENLNEEEQKIYNILNKPLKHIKGENKNFQFEDDEETREYSNDINKVFRSNFYEDTYKESNNFKEPKTEYINKLRPSAYIDIKKIFINVDTYYDKKELKFENHEFKRIELPQKVEIPQLSMNLIHVVQNPGIYTLQSVKRLNKNANLSLIENLPTPEQIQFENLDTYMRPHEDPNLKAMMKQYNYKYSSSTSGIGEALAHFFYKLTNFKSPHFYSLSEHYVNEPLKFMMFQRKPASISLNKIKDPSGTRYAISKNSLFDSKVEFILLKMGKYMEKIFTHSPEEFEKLYMKKEPNSKLNAEEILLKQDDYFKFVGYDNILLRSQIDCGGKDRDGNDIVFEIKTRAVAPIRYDVHSYQDYLDYEVSSLYGRHSSYEREYYDLIRGAFLKYLFQLKIGGMKGALVSFHNTQKIFGFEYISLLDMERRILGNSNFSDIIFKASLKMIEEVMDQITRDFPEPDKLLIGVYANEWKSTLDIFVEIVDENTYKDYDKVKPREIIDYYYLTGYRPIVHKYTVLINPILNNVITTFSPILFENNDTFHVKYQIIYSGQPDFGEYMTFMHEAFMQKENVNLLNEFTGSWTGSYDN